MKKSLLHCDTIADMTIFADDYGSDDSCEVVLRMTTTTLLKEPQRVALSLQEHPPEYIQSTTQGCNEFTLNECSSIPHSHHNDGGGGETTTGHNKKTTKTRSTNNTLSLGSATSLPQFQFQLKKPPSSLRKTTKKFAPIRSIKSSSSAAAATVSQLQKQQNTQQQLGYTTQVTLSLSSSRLPPVCKISSHRKSKFISNANASLSAILNLLRYLLTSSSMCRFKETKTVRSGLTSSGTVFGFGSSSVMNKRTTTKFRLLPSLGATSFFTILTLVCLETVLLSTVTNCAKTFYMHWNTSNSIFRIDNTDHIIDVNKGNLAFEFDQVHIICPVYEPGTYENETEKYIIYNVSKVEYETCRITNADPRVIAICDKPQKLMFFTITFRPFTPQPGGLEFLPGNDYYFISTSSKDDLYRRIGGRCSTNNMKVVFKVCCATEERNKTASNGNAIGSVGTNIGSGGNNVATVGETTAGGGVSGDNGAKTMSSNNQQQQSSHMNNVNTINGININTGLIVPGNNNNGVQVMPMNGQTGHGTSINTNIDQFNRIPIQANGIHVMNNNNNNNIGGNGIMLAPGQGGIKMIPTNGAAGGFGGIGIGQYPMHYPGQTGIRINNVAPQQHHPSHKSGNNGIGGVINNNDDQYDKHPNEVVKNEELTYNSAAASLHCPQQLHLWNFPRIQQEILKLISIIISTVKTAAATTTPENSVCIRITHIYKIIVDNGVLRLLSVMINVIRISSLYFINLNNILLALPILLTATHCILQHTIFTITENKKTTAKSPSSLRESSYRRRPVLAAASERNNNNKQFSVSTKQCIKSR